MTEEISIAEYRKLLKQPHKYGAAPLVVDGVRFDSKAEAARYAELQLHLGAGAIGDLRVHPRYTLQEAFIDRNGVRHAAIRYEADFSYIDTVTTVTVVEDVKGVQTPVFKLKAKLFRYRYPQIDYRVLKVGGRR